MPQLSAEQLQRVIEGCTAHLAEIADALRANLDCRVRLSAQPPRPFAAELLAPFATAGLAVSIVMLKDQSLLMLVPENVSLPAWYREQTGPETHRLEGFAQDLSLRLLPTDISADRALAVPSENLCQFAEQAIGENSPTWIEFSAIAADAPEDASSLATIAVLVPLDAAALPRAARGGNEDDAPSRTADGTDADAAEGANLEGESSAETLEDFFADELNAAESSAESAVLAEANAVSGRRASPASLDQALRALRILRVPVTVSVRLAERRLPLGQVVALAPGSLVTFNKSCEDLLDLFVNNHRYCQGEAVKIGENFGLKIARVGVTDQRKEHVL